MFEKLAEIKTSYTSTLTCGSCGEVLPTGVDFSESDSRKRIATKARACGWAEVDGTALCQNCKDE